MEGLRRLTRVVALVAIALAACAPEREVARERSTAPPTGAPVETTVAEPDGAASTSTPGGTGRPPSRAPATRPQAATPQPGQVAPAGAAPAGQDPVIAAAGGPPGSLARVLLQPAPARRDVLEILQQPGAVPQQATIAHAVSALREASGKTVSVGGPVALAPGPRSWTPDALRAFADGSGRAGQGDDQAVVRVLFVEGSFAPDRRALGAAVRGDVIAVFPDIIRESASPFAPASRIEDAVMMHELGHTLGLVDLVVDRNRDDPEHPGHSTNPQSVMYWAVESSLVGQVLGGPPPTEFDAADRADLAAIRSGA